MFNDASSDFDVLVASDAIGMGLNLNISRIIFSTMEKFDGIETRDLTIPEIKQIAGSLSYGSCRNLLLVLIMSAVCKSKYLLYLDMSWRLRAYIILIILEDKLLCI